MKRFQLLIFGILAMSLFLTQSCTEDDTGGGGGGLIGAPIVELLTEVGFVDLTETVEPGASFKVKLDATPDAALLSSLTIKRDNFNEDATNITFNTISTANNPQLISGDDKDGITWEITIVASEVEGTYSYDFDVTDDNQNTSTAFVTITVESATGVIAPTIDLVGNDVVSADAGTLVGIGLDLQIGDSKLKEIRVQENGSDMPVDRVYYNDPTRNFDTNPQPVDSADEDGVFPFTIYVRTVSGSNTYNIQLVDVSDLSSSTQITINEAGTPLDDTYSGILFSNNSGPENGGLDLDTGASVSTVSSTDAEVIDLGIDNGPIATNWIRKIAPANGASLRFVDLSNVSEIADFASIDTKEKVRAAWDAGTDKNESDFILEGDVFAVQKGDRYYVFIVNEVNLTDSDNLDYYSVDIKR